MVADGVMIEMSDSDEERELYVLVTFGGATTVHGPYTRREARETFVAFDAGTDADDVSLGRAPPADGFAWEAPEATPEHANEENGVYETESVDITIEGPNRDE